MITTGLVRALRDRDFDVLPFKPVSEVALQADGAPGVPEGLLHQCFAAGVAHEPEMFPVRAVSNGNLAHVWLFDDYLGMVPRLGRDMPVLSSLPAAAREAASAAIEESRRVLRARCRVLVSEGAGACTALGDLQQPDFANLAVARAADRVLLVARASNGLTFAGIDHAVGQFRAAGVDLGGFLLNDVRALEDAHGEAGRAVAGRTGVPFEGCIPWSDFFTGRPKYQPPSVGCREDHGHLAHLLATSFDLGRLIGLESVRGR